jgi:Raf kinase inhibitor-like YbhB/YbcL family protein
MGLDAEFVVSYLAHFRIHGGLAQSVGTRVFLSIWMTRMKTSELPAGAGNKDSKRLPPASVECRNDYGESGYGGPCPPPGSTHRYLVKVYALNVEKLPFRSETPPGKMAEQIETHSIGVAKLMVTFGR